MIIDYDKIPINSINLKSDIFFIKQLYVVFSTNFTAEKQLTKQHKIYKYETFKTATYNFRFGNFHKYAWSKNSKTNR